MDVAFGIHRVGNGVTFAKSKYVHKLQRPLVHAYETAKTFTDKESSRQKALFDRRSKDLRIQPADLCLVKKTAWRARPKENLRVSTDCSKVRDLSPHTSQQGNPGLIPIEETQQKQTKLRDYRNHHALE